MRSTRNQPFCWQEKKVYRLLRQKYSGSELVKLRCLYGAITEADSDFNSQDIKYYTKTISTYSGLSKDWIPTGLKILQDEIHVLKIVEDREKGRFKGKRLIFTPENVQEIPRKPVTGKPVTGKPGNGKPLNGNNDTSEDSSSSEDINSQEDSKYKIKKPVKNKHLDSVYLTTAEYKSLIKRYGKKESDSFIEDLDNYIGSKGKRYKSHYKTLLGWMKQKKVKELPPVKVCPDCKTEVDASGWCNKCEVYVVGIKSA